MNACANVIVYSSIRDGYSSMRDREKEREKDSGTRFVHNIICFLEERCMRANLSVNMWMMYINNSIYNVHKMCTKNIASYKSYIDVQFCSQYTMEYINTLKQTKKKTVHYKY